MANEAFTEDGQTRLPVTNASPSAPIQTELRPAGSFYAIFYESPIIKQLENSKQGFLLRNLSLIEKF